jgi:hypothetical protein
MHALRLCVFLTTWAFADQLLAQPAPPLIVSRGPGADDCPDAPGLLARIEEIRKSAPRADQPPYDVTFARDDHGVYSQITTVQTGAERVLTDASPDCAALAQATAVTLALLFDAHAHAPELAAIAPAPPAAPQPVAPPAHDPADEHRFIANYGAGGLVGVIAPIAFAPSLELGYAYGSWRASLGGLYVFPMSHELGSGRVVQSLYATSLLGCFAPWRHALWRFDLCSGVMAGAVSGVARGFDEPRKASRGWLAPIIEARVGRLPDRFGAELSLALLLPTTRQDFAVGGAGVAYESSPIALLASLRGTFSIARNSP